MKAGGQLLRDSSRFAAFDPRGRFQMTFGVKGKWKERKDGDKYHPGQPEMAHMRKIHSFMRKSGSSISLFVRLVPVKILGDRKNQQHPIVLVRIILWRGRLTWSPGGPCTNSCCSVCLSPFNL